MTLRKKSTVQFSKLRYSRLQICGTAQAGFNMVEIAICLGIISIALIAIMGIIPTGTRAAKDNREETIIDQDGKFITQVIRNGVTNLNGFENLVDAMFINGTAVAHNNPEPPAYSTDRIVGNLTMPGRLNSAIIRSVSGPAVDKASLSQSVAFRYLVTTEVVPFTPPGKTNITQFLNEVSLRFEWPLRPDGSPRNVPGTGSPKVYRFLVSGQLTYSTNSNNEVLAFFRP